VELIQVKVRKWLLYQRRENIQVKSAEEQSRRKRNSYVESAETIMVSKARNIQVKARNSSRVKSAELIIYHTASGVIHIKSNGTHTGQPWNSYRFGKQVDYTGPKRGVV
jgi:hypothetical protein